jgi:hypothetical protein
MKSINIWMIGISALLFWSCEGLVEDLDQSKLPKIESKLVISCFISPQSSAISVFVTQSQPLLGAATYAPYYIANAEVVLSGEAGQIRLPYRDSVYQYYVDSSAFKIIAGKTYTLSVNDGKRSVKASCTVPVNVPKITNVTIDKGPGDVMSSINQVPGVWLGSFLLRVRESWQDIVGEKNYYQVRGYMDYEIVELQRDFVTGDASLTRAKTRRDLLFYPASVNLFTDANLDGTAFIGPDIQMGVSQRDTIVYRDKNNVEHSFDNEAKVTEIRVEVMNLDENYYQYLRSLGNYKQDSKFTEPTPVYTNIEGGLGCFAAFNSAIFIDRTGW